MQAIGFNTPGGPEVLEAVELPDPVPAEGEVLLRVHAAAVNPTDTMRRAGQRGPQQADSPSVPGMDAAGVVDDVGPNTRTGLRAGDRVMAVVVPQGGHGAYSERIAVPAESVVPAPRGATHAEASTLPMNALTARLALDTLGLSPGQAVAVTGAAGALGGYAVQLAKADGLTVIADAAAADEQLVSGLGADVVLRRGERFADSVRDHVPDGVPGLIDGAMQLQRITPALQDGGTVITIRGHDDPAERDVIFQPILVADYARAHEALDTLRQQAEDGTLSLRVADELPKEQAAEAHRRLEAGGVRGRLVLWF